MKQLVIYQENSSPLIVEDDDDSKIEEFARTLAPLLETNNVSILHTSSGSIILRPNKISSIVVNEIEKTGSQESKQEKCESTEDIIFD